MRVAQRSAYGTRLAKTFYRGESAPISAVKPEDKPLSVEWLTTNCQPESVGSDRHLGALLLSLELAKSSQIGCRTSHFRLGSISKSSRCGRTKVS